MRAIKLVIVIAIIGVVAYLAAPWLEDAIYMVKLVADERPQQLPPPVVGVRSATLRDSWGDPRAGGRRHEGIDVFARRGTPVVSTTRGVVTSIGENRLGGNVVWVLGPAGDMHYYAHLDRFAELRVRQRVEPGTVLGYVGTTGNAAGTPPHLHYGIYQRAGGAINPYPLLVARPQPVNDDEVARTAP